MNLFLLEAIKKFPYSGLFKNSSEQDKKRMYSMYETCKPFIFHPEVFGEHNQSVGEKVLLKDLSIPFKCSSFEVLRSSASPSDHRNWNTANLVVFEHSPGILDMLGIVAKSSKENADSFLESFVYCPHGDKSDDRKFLLSILVAFVQTLNSGISVGSEKVNEKIKLGSGSLRTSHRIKEIIHIVPKNNNFLSYETSRKIEWTHRTWVRGHWRIHDGIGKDREGKYIVQGFTWVTEHIRYPEHLPLIEKTRYMPPIKEKIV